MILTDGKPEIDDDTGLVSFTISKVTRCKLTVMMFRKLLTLTNKVSIRLALRFFSFPFPSLCHFYIPYVVIIKRKRLCISPYTPQFAGSQHAGAWHDDFGEQNSEADAHAQLDYAVAQALTLSTLPKCTQYLRAPKLRANRNLRRQLAGETWQPRKVIIASKVSGPSRNNDKGIRPDRRWIGRISVKRCMTASSVCN